jgi:hypothetical protein
VQRGFIFSHGNSRLSASNILGSNWRVSKRHCTSRAEWRLRTGKPAEVLSAHYRFDCDYGTAVIICWEEGGSAPIYVCESHAKRLGSTCEHS